MSDIAARAGTSPAAVSVALNGAKSRTLRVSDDTRSRILEAARELGYRRHPVARALATGRTHVLGLMLPYASIYFGESTPFESVIIDGVVAEAGRRGYNLMLYSATAEDEGERAAGMVDRRIDGLIVVVPHDDSAPLQECERQGIPTAAILARPQAATITIRSDDYRGGLVAVRHLLGLGHRRIAHLYGRETVVTSEPRYQGYRQALCEAGVEPAPELCLPGDFTSQKGRESTVRWLELPPERRPTAIFAANDLSAHGAIDAIHAAGGKVPDDFSVVGYDDTWFATVTRPALTTVSMQVRELGCRAAALMISFLEGEQVADYHPVLPVSLIQRESSGPAPP
ncbi:MAG TPA: LacI family DNA-binding transcriptional regulator [Fimbriimonas sp.]